ncbi:MAG: hypothetical protein WCG42_06110 [Parachlamydiaceae bacterium]
MGYQPLNNSQPSPLRDLLLAGEALLGKANSLIKNKSTQVEAEKVKSLMTSIGGVISLCEDKRLNKLQSYGQMKALLASSPLGELTTGAGKLAKLISSLEVVQTQLKGKLLKTNEGEGDEGIGRSPQSSPPNTPESQPVTSQNGSKSVNREFSSLLKHIKEKYPDFPIEKYHSIQEFEKIGSPYHFAVENRDPLLIKLLESAGGNKLRVDKDGYNALKYALAIKYREPDQQMTDPKLDRIINFMIDRYLKEKGVDNSVLLQRALEIKYPAEGIETNYRNVNELIDRLRPYQPVERAGAGIPRKPMLYLEDHPKFLSPKLIREVEDIYRRGEEKFPGGGGVKALKEKVIFLERKINNLEEKPASIYVKKLDSTDEPSNAKMGSQLRKVQLEARLDTMKDRAPSSIDADPEGRKRVHETSLERERTLKDEDLKAGDIYTAKELLKLINEKLSNSDA